jgi:hypothetical protein
MAEEKNSEMQGSDSEPLGSDDTESESIPSETTGDREFIEVRLTTADGYKGSSNPSLRPTDSSSQFLLTHSHWKSTTNMAVTRHTYQHTLLQNARTLRSRKVVASLDPPTRLSARRKRVHQPLLSLSAENEPIQLTDYNRGPCILYLSNGVP